MPNFLSFLYYYFYVSFGTSLLLLHYHITHIDQFDKILIYFDFQVSLDRLFKLKITKQWHNDSAIILSYFFQQTAILNLSFRTSLLTILVNGSITVVQVKKLLKRCKIN